MTWHTTFPLQVDAHGSTARSDENDYIAGLVEQLLFTAPGERVNRPDFGVGVAELLFNPVSPEVAVTTQLVIHGALQQWLGDLIDVAEVLVSAEDSTLFIRVAYSARRSGQPGTVRFAIDGSTR